MYLSQVSNKVNEYLIIKLMTLTTKFSFTGKICLEHVGNVGHGVHVNGSVLREGDNVT